MLNDRIDAWYRIIVQLHYSVPTKGRRKGELHDPYLDDPSEYRQNPDTSVPYNRITIEILYVFTMTILTVR